MDTLLLAAIYFFGILFYIATYLEIIKKIEKNKILLITTAYIITLLSISLSYGMPSLDDGAMTIFVIIPIGIWLRYTIPALWEEKREKEHHQDYIKYHKRIFYKS